MKEDEYEKLLSKAHLMIPAQEEEKNRLEIPKPSSFVQGKKTIINNFGQIVKVIEREEKHLMKFISKETAAPATLAEGKLSITGKFSAVQMNKIFNSYMKNYVLCPECGKPDTKFSEQNGVKIIKCEACGAVFPLKKI
ncbi:MAG: translation initiation factor IF-2 subunit beta [Candidatus Diapherotrites archaeon]|nr:translation initiation factor IF-2 subunit beta [Candidatus Diapherotrites archaeon]